MGLRLVLVTLFRPDHPTEMATRNVKSDIMERETDLEEYNPYEWGLKAHLLTSIA